jgi:hypothetical protein
MDRRLAPALLCSLLLAACSPGPTASPGSPEPSATASPGAAAASASASASTRPSPAAAGELPRAGVLPAGRYTKTGFVPAVTFAVSDGWTVGSASDGFFDVQQEPGSPDVIALQFARPTRAVGEDGASLPVTTAAELIAAIGENPGLDVVDGSDSRLGGLAGENVVVENSGSSTTPVAEVSLGTLGFDPGRRLWISAFDTPDGVLAVIVGGSVARWEHALAVAEPVLESITVDAPSSVPSASAPGAAEPVMIPLGGRGPLGIDTEGDRAWVVLTDSGTLSEVDLAGGRVLRTIPIGPAGQQVIADEGRLFIGRYDTGAGRQGIATVDPADGSVGGIAVGPVGGLALDDTDLWAFLKNGEVRLLDPETGASRGSVSVRVDEDAHMDIVAANGSAWVAGDRTPVHRVEGPVPHVTADVETGGGIPLAVEDDLIWGARPDQIWAIDPASNRVVRHVPLVDVDEILALDVDADAGEAWVAVRRPGRVGALLGVDLSSGAVISETPVSLPAGVRLTAERAWVTDYERNELVGVRRP